MTIIIAVAAAAVAALAQVGAHLYAWDKRWTRVRRYIVGVAISNTAITVALALALDADAALTAAGLLWSVYIVSGAAVVLCYDERDRRARTTPHDTPDTTPDATRLLKQIDQELHNDTTDLPQ